MIRVTENSPGNINITCEHSQKPLTRVNEFGMFCDAGVCQCEVESKKIGNDFEELIKGFVPHA